MKRTGKFIILSAMAVGMWAASPLEACTGITLTSGDGAKVLARTIEWGGSNLNSQYVVVPRGYTEQSLVPGGADGMTFTARYGYVGFAVEQKQFVAEGLNEGGAVRRVVLFSRLRAVRGLRSGGETAQHSRPPAGAVAAGHMLHGGRGATGRGRGAYYQHRPALVHGALAVCRP